MYTCIKIKTNDDIQMKVMVLYVYAFRNIFGSMLSIEIERNSAQHVDSILCH